MARALEFVRAGLDGDGFAGRRVVVGSPAAVRPLLERIAADYGADELMLLTMTHDHGARRRSYELLAGAFGLEPAARAPVRARARR
jgi:alkanesulfonate monooxygenase SsuD/methylene tetrahydromethanopterin reductase-like flavin-dependent oxidoreductase (luciferase family)